MENQTIEQLLELKKPELQKLYFEATGQQAKPADTKELLAQAIIAKQQPAAERQLSADEKIIAENPDANPYELLEKGLSQEGFEHLIVAQSQQPEQSPETKPTLQEEMPEAKEVEQNYKEQVAPTPKAETLISQRRNEMQQGIEGEDPKKPTLIGKVTQIPGQSVAQAMNASTAKKSVDLSRYANKQGAVKIQKGNGQPELVTRATAERLMKLDPGKYKILS